MSFIRTDRTRHIATALAATVAVSRAHASALADTPDCGITTQCGLDRLLHFLYGAATFLGFVLIVVLGLALYVYRRNRRSEPHRR